MPPTSLCRHIHADGTRCEALNVMGDRFCYWHRDLTRRHRQLRPDLAKVIEQIPDHDRSPALLKREKLTAEYFGLRPIGRAELDLPPLEDADSIQIALSMVLNSLAQNDIDLKRAGKLINGLAIASSNVRRINRLRQNSVRDIVLDDAGTPLAPEDPVPDAPAPAVAL